MKYSYHMAIAFVLSTGSLSFYAAEDIQRESDDSFINKLRDRNLSEYTVVNILDSVSNQSVQSQIESKERLIETLILPEYVENNIDGCNLQQLIFLYFMRKKPRNEINDLKLLGIFNSLDEDTQQALHAYKNKKLWNFGVEKHR